MTVDGAQAAVTLCSSTEITALGRDGSTLARYPLPISLESSQTLHCAVSQEGGLFLSVNTPGAVARLDYLIPGWERAATLGFSVELASALGQSSIDILRADDGNGAYVWGTQGELDNSLEYERVVLGHIDEQGNFEFTWTTPELTRWMVPAFAWDTGGNVYLLTTEDPYFWLTATGQDTTGLCSVWDCQALVLRKISNTGTETWRYEHRKSSYARSLTLTRDGRVLVTGQRQREVATGLALVFDP